MTALFPPFYFRLALVLAATPGCGSSTTGVTTEPHPSILEVSPEEFSDNVPCAPGGGLRLYVATLLDVTPGSAMTEATAFALPSSLPTRCEQAVGFGWVVYARSYYATIEGYDREDLDALEPGIPILVDRSTREPVEPRWRASCGSKEEPTTAESQTTRRLTGCGNWDGDAPQTPTRIQVGLEDALGERACGTEAEGVESFSVRQAGRVLGSAACGEQVVLDDVVPGQFVSLEVLGNAAGASAPRFGTTCTATALSGVTLKASCEPFSETGVLAVDLETALEAVGARCDSSLDSIVIELGPDAQKRLTLGEASCRGTARFSDLIPGDYRVTLTARFDAGEPRVTACSANVEPGLASQANCEKL